MINVKNGNSSVKFEDVPQCSCYGKQRLQFTFFIHAFMPGKVEISLNVTFELTE